MPALNKLPSGGGASEPGISDGQGIVKLNVFTQLTEPSIKDGIWIKTSNKYQKVIIDNHILSEYGVWGDTKNLPYNFGAEKSTVVYNNEIHILGSYNNGYATYHYKYNGSAWSSVSTLPYPLCNGSAIVYNNQIHILTSANGSHDYKHYKWNGSTWSSVSTLPYPATDSSVTVYNNEIHILGSSYSNSSNYGRNHYKWNGSKWTKLNDLPSWFVNTAIVVYNGEINILGSAYSQTYGYNHYKWNSSTDEWTKLNDLPYPCLSTRAVIYNGEIHILGGEDNTNYYKNHYKYNGSSWTKVSTLPYDFSDGSAIVKDNSIIILGGRYDKFVAFTTPENVYDPYTFIIQRGNTNNGVYLTSIADTSVITGDNNRFISGFDDAWYFGQSAFEMSDPMYYGDGTKWIKFKN